MTNNIFQTISKFGHIVRLACALHVFTLVLRIDELRELQYQWCSGYLDLLDNIYVRFGTNLYRQIVGFPMGFYCAPHVADLFLICYERDFMASLSDDKEAEHFQAFNSPYR